MTRVSENKTLLALVKKLSEMGFNQYEIAILCRISQPTVSNIINGKYREEEI